MRVSLLAHETDAEIVRYASLLQKGRFAAAYLAIGLRRTPAS